jgi:hypothetical protein
MVLIDLYLILVCMELLKDGSRRDMQLVRMIFCSLTFFIALQFVVIISV